MKKVEDTVLYGDRRFYSAFPSVAAGEGDEILVAFRRAPDHRWLTPDGQDGAAADFDSVDHRDARSHTALMRVDGRARPVGGVAMLSGDPLAADQDPNLLRLGDGRIVLTGFGWYPLPGKQARALIAAGVGVVGDEDGGFFIFWGGYVRTSDDGGRHWSAHRPLPVLPDHDDLVAGRRPCHGGAIRGRAVELADGTLLQAAYLDRRAGARGSYLHASVDRGESWVCRGAIAADSDGAIGFMEPALCPLPDGGLLALHRTSGARDQLASALSTDHGRTWQPWRIEAVTGHPFDACPLPDGRIVVVYGYRHRPYGVRARLWDPRRQTLAEAPETIVCDDAPSPDVGYPSAAVTRSGQVLVAYYLSDAAGVRHIRASLLDPS